MYQTMALAVVALFVGAYLRRRIHFLEAFCIPAPVIGGLVFAIITCVLYVAGIMDLEFDETIKNVCMVLFFTSVGFQANMKVLKSGGKDLLIFLIAVFVLIVCQNGLATGLSKVLGIDPLIGMCTGSIPMIGGHGTAGAFGPLLEDMNVTGATTLATAAATFGLIAGSLMGGPISNRLIMKKDLVKTAVPEDDTLLVEEEEKHHRSVSMYAPAMYQLAIAAGLGTVVSYFLSMTGMTFPVYIGAMIIAAIMRNISEYTVHDIIKRDKIPTVKVDYHRRILKRDYEQWYSSQLKYRNAEDRFRDAVAEMNSITMPEMAHMLGVDRSCVYSILRSAAGKKQLNVVAIGGRKRITRDSFENWYKSQNKYVLRERKALKTQKSRQDEKGEAMTKSANPKYLTVQEAAALAGVTIKKVLYWVRGNRFPVVRVSSLIRIEKQGFQTYLRGIGGE